MQTTEMIISVHMQLHPDPLNQPLARNSEFLINFVNSINIAHTNVSRQDY